jgi:YggT family protein
VISFLSEVSEPYLRVFRRLGLQIGPLDLSPIVALFVLQFVGGLIVRLIRG